jgi:hypothetical protein
MITWVALLAGGTALCLAAERLQSRRTRDDPTWGRVPWWTFLVVATLLLKIGLTGQWWLGLPWAPLALAGPWLVWHSARTRYLPRFRLPGVGFLLGTTAAGVVAAVPFHDDLALPALAILSAVGFPLLNRASAEALGRQVPAGEAMLVAVAGLAAGSSGPVSLGVAVVGLLVGEVWTREIRRVSAPPGLVPLLGVWAAALLAS